MNTNKLQQLLKDEKFCEQLLSLEDSKQAQELLKENGVELTIEEIEKAKDLIVRMQNDKLTDVEKKAMQYCQSHENSELNEEELEAVAGGILDPFTFTLIALAIAATISTGITAHVESRGRW